MNNDSPQNRNTQYAGRNTRKYSQFRAMMALAKASFTSTMRSPSAVVFTLVFPLIFIVVFGFIGGGGFSMDVAIDSHLDKGSPLYKGITSAHSVNILEGESESEIQSGLEKGKIDAWLNIVNTSLQGRPHYMIYLKTSAASADKGRMFKLILDDAVANMNLAGQPEEKSMAVIKATEITGRKYSTIDFILPGQLGFAILSTGVFGTAFVFFGLRQTLVLKRFFATPVKRMYIVLGEGLSRLVFALIGALFIITIGYFAFHFTLIHGLLTVLNMLALSAIGLIVFMGFGFIISGVARNDNTIPPLANIVTLPQFLLSGTFFSINAFPAWLQPISRALPLTYLNDALRKVAFEGASLFDVWHQILIMVLWGIGIYIVAAKTFKWE